MTSFFGVANGPSYYGALPWAGSAASAWVRTEVSEAARQVIRSLSSSPATRVSGHGI